MRKHLTSRLGIAAAASLALALTGCGDGVELNGKIFDTLGVSSRTQKAEKEARLDPRSPLVPPPRTDKLPVPGEENTAHMAWPEDPEIKNKRASLDADKKRQQECANERKFGTASDERQGKDDPNRKCGSVLNLIWGTNSNEPNRPTEQASKQMPR